MALVAAGTALLVLSMNAWTPSTSTFMVKSDVAVVQEHVSVDYVSRNVLTAIIQHEDPDFPTRWQAFNWATFGTQLGQYLDGQADTSGSTITQQVARNLFLAPEINAPRKGIETLLAIDLASTVQHKQILEIYVNTAQFGPGIYGICAATWYYYNRPPGDVEVQQAVELAGVLAAPGHVRRVPGQPGGGIDRNADGNRLSADSIAQAERDLTGAVAEHDFEPLGMLGIEGAAEPEPDAADSCQVQPQVVADRIAQEEASIG